MTSAIWLNFIQEIAIHNVMTLIFSSSFVTPILQCRVLFVA